jgi:hypothetical protein
MSIALFPHHHWADADGLESPDPDLARTGYFHNDPDAYSEHLRGCHQVLWSKELPGGSQLSLLTEGRGLRDREHDHYLSSDSAMPAWERWGDLQGFVGETQRLLLERGRGSIHDVGWRLYDMGGMILFPGYQVERLWTINQAKGCLRARIADRLDLTLECIRLYYELIHDDTTESADLPDAYDRINPLGSVLHRYRTFFDLFGSFDGYVDFWLLNDLVTRDATGPRVDFLLPRATSDAYDFAYEGALPVNRDQYFGYLVAADDFVDKRNRRMAHAAAGLGLDVCPACLTDGGAAHRRG